MWHATLQTFCSLACCPKPSTYFGSVCRSAFPGARTHARTRFLEEWLLPPVLLTFWSYSQVSPGPVPDLGGKELDEHHSTDFATNPRVSNPGSYHRVTVEFTLNNLAANTLVNASNITDIEGSESALALDVIESAGEGSSNRSAVAPPGRARSGLDEYVCSTWLLCCCGCRALHASALVLNDVKFLLLLLLRRSASCAKHFKLLRTLVCHWLSDVMHNQSNEADTLLMNVYRWICTPTSALYEPALHSMLLSMMRKVQSQLCRFFELFACIFLYLASHNDPYMYIYISR